VRQNLLEVQSWWKNRSAFLLRKDPKPHRIAKRACFQNSLQLLLHGKHFQKREFKSVCCHWFPKYSKWHSEKISLMILYRNNFKRRNLIVLNFWAHQHAWVVRNSLWTHLGGEHESKPSPWAYKVNITGLFIKPYWFKFNMHNYTDIYKNKIQRVSECLDIRTLMSPKLLAQYQWNLAERLSWSKSFKSLTPPPGAWGLKTQKAEGNT